MQDLENILITFEDKTPEEQAKILDQFLEFTDEEIKELTCYPKEKTTEIALQHIGYPRLKKFIPELLGMVPYSGAVAKLLASIEGDLIIPSIKEAFKVNDAPWHCDIILSIINHWDKDLVMKIKDDLIELTLNGGGEHALICLVDKKVINKEEIRKLILKDENFLNTCLYIIEDEPEWENLDQIVFSLLEVQDDIAKIANESLFNKETHIRPYDLHIESSRQKLGKYPVFWTRSLQGCIITT